MPNYQSPIRSISLTGNMMQIVAVIKGQERQIPVKQIFILPVLEELEKRGLLEHLQPIVDKIRNEITSQSQSSRSRTAETAAEPFFNEDEREFLVDNMLRGRTNYEGSLFLHFDEYGHHSRHLANISRSRAANTIVAFDLDDTLVNTSKSYYENHEIEVFDGVVDLIRDLIFAGVKVVVITHSLHTDTDYAQAFIRALNLSNLRNCIPIISIADICYYFNHLDQDHYTMIRNYGKGVSAFMMQLAIAALNIPVNEIHNYNLIVVGDNPRTDGRFAYICKKVLGFKNVNYILASWYRVEENTEEYNKLYEQFKDNMLDLDCKVLMIEDKIKFKNQTRNLIRQFFTHKEQSQTVPTTTITIPRDDTYKDENEDKILYVVELVDLILMFQNNSVTSCIDIKAVDAVKKLSERHKVVIVGHIFDLGHSPFLSQIKQEFALNRNVQILTFNRSGEMNNMHPMHRHMRNFGKFHSLYFMETALTRFGISQEELNNYHLRIVGNIHHYEMQFARRCKSMAFKSVSLFMVLVKETTYLHRELRHAWERFTSLHGIICEHIIYSIHDLVHPIYSRFVEPEFDMKIPIDDSTEFVSTPFQVSRPHQSQIAEEGLNLNFDGNPLDNMFPEIENDGGQDGSDDWGSRGVTSIVLTSSNSFQIPNQNRNRLMGCRPGFLGGSRAIHTTVSLEDLESIDMSDSASGTHSPPPPASVADCDRGSTRPLRVANRGGFSSRVVEERSLEPKEPDEIGM